MIGSMTAIDWAWIHLEIIFVFNLLWTDSSRTPQLCVIVCVQIGLWFQGSHRLEKYLNIQECLEKYLKNTQRP